MECRYISSRFSRNTLEDNMAVSGKRFSEVRVGEVFGEVLRADAVLDDVAGEDDTVACL